MRAGLPISLALHAAVLWGGTIAFSKAKPLEEGRIVPVTLVSIAEVTDIRAAIEPPTPKPKPVIEPEPDEPMQVLTAADNAPDEADETRIAPDEEAVPEPVVPPEAEPDDEVEPEPEKVAEAKPVFDLDRISTLIDKRKDVSTTANTQQATEADVEKLVYADRAREGIGTGTKMTVSELNALQTAMYKCWRMPADAADLEKLVVRLQVDMLPGGFVKDVQVIDRAAQRRKAPGNAFWDVAEMRAVQAVTKCAPYDFLPEEKFDQWESLILNFRPKL